MHTNINFSGNFLYILDFIEKKIIFFSFNNHYSSCMAQHSLFPWGVGELGSDINDQFIHFDANFDGLVLNFTWLFPLD